MATAVVVAGVVVLVAGGGCKKGGDGAGSEGAPGSGGKVSVSGLEFELPFDLENDDVVLYQTRKLQTAIDECVASTGLGACLAKATGNASICDDVAIVDEQGGATCRDWATIRGAVGTPAKCEAVTAPPLKAACMALANAGAAKCEALGADVIPDADARKLVQENCDRVMAADKPTCPAPADEKLAWVRDACETMVVTRALGAGRPELCDGLEGPDCRAFVTQDAGVCFPDKPKGLEAAAAIARARRECRKFVIDTATAQRTEGDKVTVGLLALAGNPFPEAANVRLVVTIRAGEGKTTTVTRDVGKLSTGSDVQQLSVTFEKPVGAEHEVKWEADWL